MEVMGVYTIKVSSVRSVQTSLVWEKSLRVLSTPRLTNGFAGVLSLPSAWLRCLCCVAVSFFVMRGGEAIITLLLVWALVMSPKTCGLAWKSWLRGSGSTPSKSSALPMMFVWSMCMVVSSYGATATGRPVAGSITHWFGAAFA